MMVAARSNKIRLARLLALGLALAAILVVAFAPSYSSGETLLQVNGALPLLIVSGVALIAAVPLLLSGEAARRTALYSGIALALTTFVTVIGMLFLPTALLLIYSGLARRA